MFKLRHIFKQADAQQEREFERINVEGKRGRYLETNPLQRYEIDIAYREKVDRIKVGLGKPSGLILDIGGNTAGEATLLKQLGYEIIVGDINETALDISRQRVEKFGLKAPGYVALDVHHLPFKDESFSAVTVIEALHHFVDYDQALKEIHRILKPGGNLFSLEPYALNPLRRASEIRDRLRGTIEKSFYISQLTRLCQNAGFVQINVASVATGRSSWKLKEVPVYRRPITHLHAWLSLNVPAIFGTLRLEASKAGNTIENGKAELGELFCSPKNKNKLRRDPDKKIWVEENGQHAFPELNGIPLLIAEDAIAVRD
jgi:ubiquinone/menaquinone biosynthesis C-methylase UbiE